MRKVRGLKLVITTGASGVTLEVKTVNKPAGSPSVPSVRGKNVSYFRIQESKGSAVIKAAGRGTLYAYNTATNSWQKTSTNTLEPGTVYAWVPGKVTGKKR